MAVERLAPGPAGPSVGDLAPTYRTARGFAVRAKAEDFLDSRLAARYRGRVQLIFTSPPFPLNRKKKYGNATGDEYLEWLAAFAPRFIEMLKPNGSIVVEMGNAWERGEPVMSTLALQALLKFLERGGLRLCQQFVAYNRARLPSPAPWVTIERIRVKDAFTHIWWMSPTARPKASNERVLKDYSPAMLDLLRTKKYNAGARPSQHHISQTSFLTRHRGAIPSNVIEYSNTGAFDPYQEYCRQHDLTAHPARMPVALAEFFVRMLTTSGEYVLDPFAGSNTTGAVAERLGRRWIAVEPDAGYLEGSRGRFQTFNPHLGSRIARA
jgi:DNA modification methylase